MKLTPNSNTCHCTAQFTTSSLRNLHVWVLQSWGELVRWLCVLAERGYTTWPPLHYFAFVSKFKVSDFRANEVQFTTSLWNPLLESGSPEFVTDWKELHKVAVRVTVASPAPGPDQNQDVHTLTGVACTAHSQQHWLLVRELEHCKYEVVLFQIVQD